MIRQDPRVVGVKPDAAHSGLTEGAGFGHG
jgi:hypothetical protein